MLLQMGDESRGIVGDDSPRPSIADLVLKARVQFPGLHFPYIELPEHPEDCDCLPASADG